MSNTYDTKVLGVLLGMLAHDLRNPLAAIHSNLGFLDSFDELSEDSVEAVQDGLVSCDGLSHIIDNIELLGNRLKGPPRPPRDEVRLSEVVQQAIEQCGAAAKSHETTISLDPEAAESGVTVVSARDDLRRCISNLVRNGIQMSRPGDGVRLSFAEEGDHVAIWIEDDGASPDVRIRERIFTAQGQSEAKDASTGRYSRGLGLLCARIAADGAGAEVRVVEPREGSGNAFRVTVRKV